MYNNVLVPVVFDHGDRSAQSVEVAKELLNSDGKITLLHVVEEIPSYASSYLPEGFAQHQHQEVMDSLTKMAEDLDVPCDAAVIHGHSSSSILEYGDKHGVDCIVIASHKPGIEDYFLGSTAARVVRHARCGVHILR